MCALQNSAAAKLQGACNLPNLSRQRRSPLRTICVERVFEDTVVEQASSSNGHLPPSTRIFLSYARADCRFADELIRGLKFDGSFEVYVDRTDIHESEAGRERLAALISGAQVVVFLMSTKSLASEICHWEVETADAFHKRIVPVLIEPLDGGVTAPPKLVRRAGDEAIPVVCYAPYATGPRRYELPRCPVSICNGRRRLADIKLT